MPSVPPTPPPPDDLPADAPSRDPRLEIPEVLRTPVRQSNFDPVTGNKADRKDIADAAGIGRAWAVALDFVFTIIGGALIGWLIDYWRGTLPLWTLIGLGAGFVSAFIRIVRMTLRQEREEKARRDRR